MWKPYSELPEDVKEKDREWARKVIAILREEMNPKELQETLDLGMSLRNKVARIGVRLGEILK